jgi:hypothetical protein
VLVKWAKEVGGRDALLTAGVCKPSRLTSGLSGAKEAKRDALLTAGVGKPSRLTSGLGGLKR